MDNELDSGGAEIEAMLEPLVRQYGIDQVKEHLSKLWPRSHFADYMRVYNYAERIARRIYEEQKTEGTKINET